MCPNSRTTMRSSLTGNSGFADLVVHFSMIGALAISVAYQLPKGAGPEARQLIAACRWKRRPGS